MFRLDILDEKNDLEDDDTMENDIDENDQDDQNEAPSMPIICS
jgi:hypothetical protein